MSINSIGKKIWYLIGEGQFRMLLGRILYRIYSRTESYGLRRDLQLSHHSPEPDIPLTIRPIRESDIHSMFGFDDDSDPEEREERMARMLLLASGIPTCYVAVTESGEPCFAGWLFSSADNDRIKQYYGNGFPPLKPDEALFEFAYTREKFRGKRIMPWSMGKIAEEADKFGARYVYAFADSRNDPTLRRCRLAGFSPFLRRSEQCFLMRRTVAFKPMSKIESATILKRVMRPEDVVAIEAPQESK